MLTTDGSADRVAFSFQCHIADCTHLTRRYKLCLWNYIVSIEKLLFLHTQKVRGLNPTANYTDRAAAAGRRS
jgi:hypothetical protein